MKAHGLGEPRPSPRSSASAGRAFIGCWKRKRVRQRASNALPQRISDRAVAGLGLEAAAEERMKAGKGPNDSGGRGKKKNPGAIGARVKRAPRAADKVAQATGMDARTLACTSRRPRPAISKAEHVRLLMAVARDPRIANRAHVRALPPSWGTLYVLSKLDDEQWQKGIAGRPG
jgi:hypothetical protein